MWKYCKDCFWAEYDPRGIITSARYYCWKERCYSFEEGCYDSDDLELIDLRNMQSCESAVEDPRRESPPRFIPLSLLKELLGLIRKKEGDISSEDD